MYGNKRIPVTLHGIIDENGNEIIAPEYDSVQFVYDNYYIVQDLKNYGLRDNEGNIVLKEMYAKIEELFYPFFKVGNHDGFYALYNVKENLFCSLFVFEDIRFVHLTPITLCKAELPKLILAKKDCKTFYFGSDCKFHLFII